MTEMICHHRVRHLEMEGVWRCESCFALLPIHPIAVISGWGRSRILSRESIAEDTILKHKLDFVPEKPGKLLELEVDNTLLIEELENRDWECTGFSRSSFIVDWWAKDNVKKYSFPFQVEPCDLVTCFDMIGFQESYQSLLLFIKPFMKRRLILSIKLFCGELQKERSVMLDEKALFALVSRMYFRIEHADYREDEIRSMGEERVPMVTLVLSNL